MIASVEERLNFFNDLIYCNYRLFQWKYDSEFQLISTNCPEENLQDVLERFHLKRPETLPLQMKNTPHAPMILVTNLQLMWITDCERVEGALRHIYAIGPFFSGKYGRQAVRKIIMSPKLSHEIQRKVMQFTDTIAVIPSMIINQYAVMLHYCLTGERVSADTVIYFKSGKPNTESADYNVPDAHGDIWAKEELFTSLLCKGDPECKRVMFDMFQVSNGVRLSTGDPLRQTKVSVHTLLVICSRSCIRGGLSPAVSYSFHDYYSTAIENCVNVSQLHKMAIQLVDHFCEEMAKLFHTEHPRSSEMQNVCQYVERHISDPLDVHTLAQISGYSDYYFSTKFKEEIGATVDQYIRRCRIHRAKILLAGTQKSIQEITDELGFNSRSYFFTCFKKETGMAPMAYRNKFYKG